MNRNRDGVGRRDFMRGLTTAAGGLLLARPWSGQTTAAAGLQSAPARRQGIQAPHPNRKQVLAWGDVRYGQQHDSVTRAMITIERLGRESGLYDTYIRTDSQLITKEPIVPEGAQFPMTNKDLRYFHAIFFYGVREIALTPQQKTDLLSFVKDDGKGFVGAHTATTAFFSWPEFGDLIGGRFDNHPWGITDARVIVEDAAFPAMKPFTSGAVDGLHLEPHAREQLLLGVHAAGRLVMAVPPQQRLAVECRHVDLVVLEEVAPVMGSPAAVWRRRRAAASWSARP